MLSISFYLVVEMVAVVSGPWKSPVSLFKLRSTNSLFLSFVKMVKLYLQGEKKGPLLLRRKNWVFDLSQKGGIFARWNREVVGLSYRCDIVENCAVLGRKWLDIRFWYDSHTAHLVKGVIVQISRKRSTNERFGDVIKDELGFVVELLT